MANSQKHSSMWSYIGLIVLIAVLLVLRGGIKENRTASDQPKAVGQTETEESIEELDGVYPTMETFSGKQLPYTDCLTLEATAYSAGGKTATGTLAGEGTVAVDPDVIPLGSKLYIVAEDGSSWAYGYAVAEDTGGAIQGDRIDLFYESESDCRNFGRKMVKVYLLAD